MKAKIFSLLIVGALFVTQSGVVLAQGRGWSAVQAVGTDERLIVKLKDGKTIDGKMIEANDANLSISHDKKVVNISRDNIAQVEHSRGRAKKGKWALIGAGVGAAAGGGVGATQVHSFIDDSEIWLPVGLIFGAGIGAASGALFGATRRHRDVIYSAP